MKFELTKFKSNSIQQLDQNSIELSSNQIENKWYSNWWRKYSKSFCEYDIGNVFLKKRHKSMILHLGMS
jgi:hypothetical protein